jgi:hypothetical protein
VSTRQTSFDWTSVSRATWIAAAGALVLLIGTFLTWFSASVSIAGIGGAFASESGWDSGTLGKLCTLLALVALVVIAIELFSPQTTLPVAPGMALLGCGGIATLFVIIKLFDKPSTHGLSGISVGYGFGIWLSLIAAIGLAVGGYLKMQED